MSYDCHMSRIKHVVIKTLVISIDTNGIALEILKCGIYHR